MGCPRRAPANDGPRTPRMARAATRMARVTTRMAALAACSVVTAHATTRASPPAPAADPACVLPRELVVPRYARFMSPNPRYRVMRLYPMGWSEKGSFAWITAEYFANLGRASFTFAITDATGKGEGELVREAYPVADEASLQKALAAFWKDHRLVACAAVARHGIVAKAVELAPLPYVSRDDVTDLQVRAGPGGSAGGGAGDGADLLSLVCTSKKQGEKKLAELPRGDSPWGVHRLASVNAIAGPRPDLVLFLVETEEPRGEGQPARVYFDAYGCDLSQIAPAVATKTGGPPASPGGCAVPQELVFPQYARFVSDNVELYVTRLFPIGWSARGLFAWIATDYQDSADISTATFVVFDTVTDRPVKVIEESYTGGSTDGRVDTLARFWNDGGARVCAALEEHAVAQGPVAFSTFPLALDGDRIDAYLKPGAPPATQGAPASLSLMCRTRDKGEKRIATLESVWTPQGVRTPSPIGAIVSPSRQRLVVMTALRVPGGEGPPEHVSFQPYGCDLAKQSFPRSPRR